MSEPLKNPPWVIQDRRGSAQKLEEDVINGRLFPGDTYRSLDGGSARQIVSIKHGVVTYRRPGLLTLLPLRTSVGEFLEWAGVGGCSA